MARKTKDAPRQPWEVDFVRLELDEQQKKKVQTWDTTGEQTFQCLHNCSLAGCKLSVVHDGRNDCYIASLTTPKVEGGERQRCFSARGPDILASFRVLAFKIVFLLDSDLDALQETAEARSQWG